jgi:hypothetical protein
MNLDQNYISKPFFLNEMKNLQEIIYNEIDLKV